MAQRDAWPPFAAIDGAVPPEFSALPTPCYLLDEAALTRNAEILGGLARRTGCKVLLAQKAFSNYDLYPLLAPHLAAPRPAACLRRGSARRKCPAKKCTFSARPTAQMKWTSCCGTLTISSSTRPRSWQIWPRGQGGGQKCGTAHQSRVLDPGRPRDLRPLRPRQPFGHDPRPVGRGSGRKFCPARAVGRPALSHFM